MPPPTQIKAVFGTLRDFFFKAYEGLWGLLGLVSFGCLLGISWQLRAKARLKGRHQDAIPTDGLANVTWLGFRGFGVEGLGFRI